MPLVNVVFVVGKIHVYDVTILFTISSIIV